MNEEQEQNILKPGTWDRMNTEPVERKPVIRWGLIGDTHSLTISCDDPVELINRDKGGVFYSFDCIESLGGVPVDKVILTSAWTLLKGLKENVPLMNKQLIISKELIKGKQSFKVIDLNKPRVETVE